jgi:hypothetical protein
VPARAAVLVPWLVLALLLGASMALRGQAHAAHQSGQRYEDVYYLPPSSWLPVFSLGWDEAVADLLWMRALVYFGDELRNSGDVRHVLDYADAIVTLDPHFLAPYLWAGMAGLYRPVAVSPEDAWAAVRFMQRGERYFPDEGRLVWEIGSALAFELPPLIDDPEEDRRVREEATEYLMAASRLGAAPDWAVLANSTLLDRIGRQETAARHLEEMYLSVSDEGVRQEIATRIRQLRQNASEDAAITAMRDIEARRFRERPYLPVELFLLVESDARRRDAAVLRDGWSALFADP